MSQDLDSSLAGASVPEGGRFSVIRCLGVGPKAETYLCSDAQTDGTPLVRKILLPEVSAELPDIVDAVFPPWADLTHPNLAKVIDFGWEEGRAFLNSEYIEGTPLLQALAAAPLDKVWKAFGQILLALDHLYAHNVPHLDLKPQNVLVTFDAAGDPVVKLVDYGWMSLLYPFNPADSNAIGTAPFTAPEYALRRSPDLRADLYSVGVLLFSVLARRPPYEGKDPAAILQAQLQRDAPALKSVVSGAPVPLSDFLQKMLSRDPQGRFESPQQALGALQVAVGSGFPEAALSWPPAFSDLSQVFRSKEALKLFRRIAIQGGRWAIQGPEGSGKSFFGRWLERLLASNQKNVLRLSGENLSLIQGEISLNPAFPTYLIIDDADKAPTEAWLQSRPYGHVIALGRDMAWAKRSKAWQFVEWKPLDPAELNQVLESRLGKLDPRVSQVFQSNFKGLARALILGAAALERQGLLRHEAGAWNLDSENLLRLAASPQAATLASPLAGFAEPTRKAMARLALSETPVLSASLPEGMEFESALQAGALRRRLKGGEEFFQSSFAFDSWPQSACSENEFLTLLEDRLRQGWADEVWRALEHHFPRAGASPQANLLRARVAAELGHFSETLTILNSGFVNALQGAAKSLAMEALGKALVAMGKAPQAEAAIKNAFQGFKAIGDAAGQARSLLLMGALAREGGDTGKALQFFQQALTVAESAESREELKGRIELAVAQLYAGATDLESAEAHFQSALASLEAARQGDALALGYTAYAAHCFEAKDPDRAEVFCHEALGWALFQGASAIQGKIFLLWARILRQREDMRGATGRLSEAIEILAKSPDEGAYARALLARAEFAESLRDLTTAQRDSRKAFELARRLKSPELEGETLLVVGKIQSRDLEKLDTAIKTLQGARQILEKAKSRQLWECDFQLGEIARFRGENSVAKGHYQRALAGLDGALATLPPQGEAADNLGRRRRELEMSMQVLG